MNYERWYWILRGYVGEETWLDLYDEFGDDEE